MDSCKFHSSERIAVPPFRSNLLAWYDTNARDLPWRKDRDPYRVWVSEIMLQQTRVAAVLEHYRKFLRRFPTVQKLAAARESSVLAVWSGLGYYRRARMLHAAAKVIANKRGGTFPKNAAELRDLPGVGRYTAAAIASIAFGEPVAVVDGNVARVLERLCGTSVSSGKAWQAAAALLDRERPGDFNQAMMELGATVCTPRAPACLTCPVVDLCATRGERPFSAKPIRQKKREIHYALHCRNGSVFLVQRAHDLRLMPGMWELPEIDADLQIQKEQISPRARTDNPADHRNDKNNRDLAGSGLFLTLRHSITLTDYTVRVWQVPKPSAVAGSWVPLQKAASLPLTGLARKILQRASNIRQTPAII